MIGRMHYIAAMFFLLAAGAELSGCAPVFPKDITDRVDRRLFFKELQSDPEKFKGSWVMMGGAIVSSKNIKDGTLIEVLQKPLDRDGRPLETDQTGGRFLVESSQFLDSAVYHRDRLITVVGEVEGGRTMPIDEIMYHFPLLSAKALHMWGPSSSGPHFFFGIGVSGRM